MDLDRMLFKCHRDQWSVGDLDWTRPPPPMSEEQERMVVQFFTDMAAIERLAGALFEEQRRKTDDPVLQDIFTSFVKDEMRHSHCAQMLADHYDVHHYQLYETTPALRKFAPHFVRLVRHLSPEIANAYITAGELILDVALLRSLDDYVDDEMSHEAMERINRDESRHIAIDFHMVEYYCSPEYLDALAAEPDQAFAERVRAWSALVFALWHAKPFFQQVFFAPMEVTDPTGRRIKEAFKRIQLLSRRPAVRKRPFIRFMTSMQDAYNHPLGRLVAGRVLLRAIGADPSVLEILFTDEEAERANRMSFTEMAEEALQAKTVTA